MWIRNDTHREVHINKNDATHVPDRLVFHDGIGCRDFVNGAVFVKYRHDRKDKSGLLLYISD